MPKLDIDEGLLRKLAQLLHETGLTEIEYENNGQRIRVNRGGGPTMIAAAPAAGATPSAGGAAPQAAPAGPPAGAVTSPMVGTAYLAPEPGAEPFVKTGDKVKKGQTLLIIEARLRCESIAPAARWGSGRSPFIPPPMPMPCMCGSPMRVCASDHRLPRAAI
jgi:acetyl-CoA carboxylase biotin carboxyl carrier protein